MGFQIQGLPVDGFRHLYGLSDAQLKGHGAYRYVADSHPGYPDRIEMRDAEIGEALLLANHVSMDKPTPYRASHAIFVREGAETSYQASNAVPDVMHRRLISLRAFDHEGMMTDAVLAEGDAIRPAIERLLGDASVDHIDAHYALRGCYAARVTRA